MKYTLVIILFVAILASCTPSVAATITSTSTPVPTIAPPTPTLAPTVEPTKTPGPTGAELQSMSLEQLKEKYPELSKMADAKSSKSAANDFINAMGIKPEELGNLTPVLKTGPEGNSILGLTNADGYPVIVGVQQEDGRWIWNKPYIKLITSVPFGCEALDGGHDKLKFDIMRNVFNQWTVGSLDWKGASPSEKKDLDYPIQDWYFRQAIANKQPINFMHIIYGNEGEVPDWLINGNYGKEELITKMQEHITGVMKKFRRMAESSHYDLPITYTVVNESVNASNFWTRRVGPEYVQLAFDAARKADPKAILIYNDNNHEMPNMPSARGVFEVVKNLKEQGLIDGVGMQMHFTRGDGVNPNLPIDVLEEGIRSQIDKYASIGVKTYITELDVDMSGISGTPEQKKQKAAEIYAMITRIALTNNNVAQISLWGVNTESSWISDLPGPRDPILLFKQDRPELTYYVVTKVLFDDLE